LELTLLSRFLDFQGCDTFLLALNTNLATVIPAMDHIDETLTTQSQDSDFEPSIRAALGIAKKTLNKYYDKTDHSEVYHIAMCEFFINLNI
jgi:hypothetical protein